jgi:hypothetical protein
VGDIEDRRIGVGVDGNDHGTVRDGD